VDLVAASVCGVKLLLVETAVFDVVAARGYGVIVELLEFACVNVVAASDSGTKGRAVRVHWCGCGSNDCLLCKDCAGRVRCFGSVSS